MALSPLGHASLHITDVRQQLDSAFWQAYLPSGESASASAITFDIVGTWIPTVRHLADQDSNTRLALDSCMLMAMGRTQGNSGYVRQGMALYGRALRDTNRALQHEATARTVGTLAACKLLAMCEVHRADVGGCVSTQGTDWQRHIKGVGRLLQLRGPNGYAESHGFMLFIDARTSMALAGITRRRSVFLSAPNWLQLPWHGRARPRSLRDELIDLMLAVATLLEQLESYACALEDTPFANQAPWETIVDQALAIAGLMSAWEKKALTRAACDSQQGESSGGKGLNEQCGSHGFGFFYLVMQYWAVCLIHSARCWMLIRTAGPVILQLNRLASELPSPQSYAVNIAEQANRYFLLNTGMLGPQSASFPMGVALHYLAATGQEQSAPMQTIRRLLHDNERARSTSTFLRSMAADPAPPAVTGDAALPDQHAKMAANWFRQQGT